MLKSGPKHAIGNQDRVLHRGDIMHADDVRTRQHGSSDSGGSRVFRRPLTNCTGKKRLARWACHHRKIQRHQFTQPGQQFEILFLALAEAKTRIEYDLRPLHAGVAKQNLASLRVLQKCGFTLDDSSDAQLHDANGSHLFLVFR